MKKKIGLLALATLAALSLTSCTEYILSILSGDTSSDTSAYTPIDSSNGGSQSSGGSSSEQSAGSSTDIENIIEAKKASCNYMDVVENSAYPISSTPCVGAANILVIPVWFTNSSNFIRSSTYKANVKSDIETAYFGTNNETGWRSVKTYYEEESHGALTITGKVSDWYECGKAYSYYAQDADTSKTISLIDDATNWYFQTNTSDKRKNYDKDGDGYLDGVMVIYAAPDYVASSTDSNDNLWAYCFWAQEPNNQNPSNPGLNAFFWASYDFMYGNNSTKRAGSSYQGGDTSYCNVDAHTYIHEMGHMFGLDDYYDYSDNKYTPAGSFSMQDCNVGSHDPFSCYALGWGKAYVPTESMTINLKPFVSSGEMILLSPSFNSYNSPFDEYLLLEFYTPTGLNEFDSLHQYSFGSGYPKGPSQSGIRLWHVDARLAYTRTGEFSASKLTTNPKITNNVVALAMTNTYNDGQDDTQDYLSVLGVSYANYNLLQLIRNNTSATYRPKDALSNNLLFKAGSSFNMSDYGRQFVNSGKLNSQKDLGYSFTVNSIDGDNASITISKL